MNRSTLRTGALALASMALCGVALAADPPAAPAAQAAAPSSGMATCAAVRPLNPVQQRLIDHAALGIVPLRQYIWQTRMIHQLDLQETADWIDSRRTQQAECQANPTAATS
jgi:hypothetical protein